jgi:hypothetical protein
MAVLGSILKLTSWILSMYEAPGLLVFFVKTKEMALRE